MGRKPRPKSIVPTVSIADLLDPQTMHNLDKLTAKSKGRIDFKEALQQIHNMPEINEDEDGKN